MDKEVKIVIAKTWIVNVIMEFVNTKLKDVEDEEIKNIIYKLIGELYNITL